MTSGTPSRSLPCRPHPVAVDTFAAESTLLRALQAATDAPRTAALQTDAACIYVNDAAHRIDTAARTALAAMAEGDTLRTHLAALRRLTKVIPVNTIEMRRRLAETTVDRAGYIFA